MRIGLNLLYLIPNVVGGTQTYAVSLIKSLAKIDSENEYFVFLNQESNLLELADAPNFHRNVCKFRATRRVTRYLWEQMVLPFQLCNYQLDLVHSLGYVGPLFASCPSIVTIPDLNYRVFGDQMSAQRRRSLAFFVKQSALRARRVIAISEYSRRQIVQAFNLPEDRVVVTTLAAKHVEAISADSNKARQALEQFNITTPYCVAFGNRGANKNIPNLLQAFALARQRCGTRHQLVIIGHLSPHDLAEYVDVLDQEAIRITGYLNDDVMNALLSQANFLIVPSFYEGFGLPVLEAMAVGVPVICSNAAALPEVAGDAALFFDPHSVEEMAERIVEICGNEKLQSVLREKGYENLKAFSWEKTAEKTLRVYYESIA